MNSTNKYRKVFEGCKLKKTDKRAKKFAAQRRNRGWDDTTTWNIDNSLAKLICPRLKRFKELTNGYPSDMTFEEWHQVLDKMIDSFALIADGAMYDYFNDKALMDKIQEGLDLFAKHYMALWW